MRVMHHRAVPPGTALCIRDGWEVNPRAVPPGTSLWIRGMKGVHTRVVPSGTALTPSGEEEEEEEDAQDHFIGQRRGDRTMSQRITPRSRELVFYAV